MLGVFAVGACGYSRGPQATSECSLPRAPSFALRITMNNPLFVCFVRTQLLPSFSASPYFSPTSLSHLATCFGLRAVFHVASCSASARKTSDSLTYSSLLSPLLLFSLFYFSYQFSSSTSSSHPLHPVKIFATHGKGGQGLLLPTAPDIGRDGHRRHVQRDCKANPPDQRQAFDHRRLCSESRQRGVVCTAGQ